jgi:ParB family chromosome partitioning protein
MSNNEIAGDSIYFIETHKIVPNPYQPRRDFDEARLKDLADSIRQYGVLQPLVVSRIEIANEDGGFNVNYELIAGERRLRASRLAGLTQVPAVIRKEENPMMKLELAIIENLQREDLSPIDRARAFLRLSSEFKFSHADIGRKVGKSREYVSNSLRMLQMPQEIIDALAAGKINEGHTRPILMLNDRPDEQSVLFKEIVYKKMTVREAERIARGIAKDKVRKPELLPDPEIEEMENKLRESLGTRVRIDRKELGGKITIDFFSRDDLNTLIEALQSKEGIAMESIAGLNVAVAHPESNEDEMMEASNQESDSVDSDIEYLDDRDKEEKKKSEEDTDLYNISNFSI